MVKFAAREDSAHAGPVEFAYTEMARDAGIEIPETRLFEVGDGQRVRRYFGVKRFDRREGNRRCHLHTFANLVYVNFRIPTTDYEDLLRVTRALTRSYSEMAKVFRLMVFNVAVHNRDDHGKNFSYRLDHDRKEWCFAPAYDLTFSEGPGGEHSQTVIGEGRNPGREQIMELARRVGMKRSDALGSIDAVNSAVGEWKRISEEAGVPLEKRREIGGRIRVV